MAAFAPQCSPGQEFFCKTNSMFAWCEDQKYVETCPLNLLCDIDLEYICVQRQASTSSPIDTTTILIPDDETNWDNSTFPDYEDVDDPWDGEASPPSSCLKAGRFPDIHECNTYHICIPDIVGNLSHTTVKCPRKSHYSTELGRCTIPEKAKCDPDYTNFKCPSSGRIPDPKDCNSFILCYPDSTWKRYFCPLHSYFDPETLKCSFSKTVCQPLLNKFNCTKRGLFDDKNDCRKFYYCIPYLDKLVEGFAFCPKNSVFNPKTSRCTTDFNACDIIQTFCKGKRPGKYPNIDDCSSFYVCTPGNATSVSYKCPYGSHYSPQKSRCVFESQSTCGRAIQPCTEEGRFADFNNNCSGFYVCVQKHHNWTKQHYKCPGNSIFDVVTKRCSQNTTCQDTFNNIAI